QPLPDVRRQGLANFTDLVADQVDVVDQPFRRGFDAAVVDRGGARDRVGVLQRAIVCDQRPVEIESGGFAQAVMSAREYAGWNRCRRGAVRLPWGGVGAIARGDARVAPHPETAYPCLRAAVAWQTRSIRCRAESSMLTKRL